MFLHQLFTNCSQQVLAGRYGIDQAAVSRHLWAIRHILNVLGVMPTPWTMAEELREAVKKFAQNYIKGVFNVDCKHTRSRAPPTARPTTRRTPARRTTPHPTRCSSAAGTA